MTGLLSQDAEEAEPGKVPVGRTNNDDWRGLSNALGKAGRHVATGRLDILFANSQFTNMLEWEDPTARSDELTKAGTER